MGPAAQRPPAGVRTGFNGARPRNAMRVLSGRSTRSDVLLGAFDHMGHEVIVLDDQGRVIIVNEPFLAFGRANGWAHPQEALGQSYLSACMEAAQRGEREGARVARGLTSILMGQREAFATTYACHSPWQERWFRLNMTAWESDGERRVILVHENITADHEADRAVEQALAGIPSAARTQYSIRLQARLDALAARLESLSGQGVTCDGTDTAVVTAPEALLTGLADLILHSPRARSGPVMLALHSPVGHAIISIHGLRAADDSALEALVNIPGRCDVIIREGDDSIQLDVVLQRAEQFEA